MIHETFNDWFNYVTFKQLAHAPYHLVSTETAPAVRYNFDNHPHYAKTPISKAYLQIAKITPTDQRIENYFEPEYIRARPCYDIPLPDSLFLRVTYVLHTHIHSTVSQHQQNNMLNFINSSFARQMQHGTKDLTTL